MSQDSVWIAVEGLELKPPASFVEDLEMGTKHWVFNSSAPEKTETVWG